MLVDFNSPLLHYLTSLIEKKVPPDGQSSSGSGSAGFPPCRGAVMALTEALAICQPLHKGSAGKGKLIRQTLWHVINLFESSNLTQSLLCLYAIEIWALIALKVIAPRLPPVKGWHSDCSHNPSTKRCAAVSICLLQSRTFSSTFSQLFLCFVRQHMVEYECTHGKEGKKLTTLKPHDL